MKTLQTLLAGTCFLLLFTFNSTAQSVGINNTGASADASALLDLSATDKGFLITRADTLNINAPAFGLLTLSPADSCLYLYNGINWMGMGGAGSNCACNIKAHAICEPYFTDARDNKTYGAVEIGNQCWMSQNLAYLPSVDRASTDGQTTPRYYVYSYIGTNVSAAKNNPSYSAYGVLYNWTAAMGGSASSDSNPSGVQGACPDGWHVPSDAEWKELEIFLGLPPAEADNTDWRGTDHALPLKEVGTTYWNFGNAGTNTTGFTARGNGMRHSANGAFYSVRNVGHWTCATENPNDVTSAWRFRMDATESRVNRLAANKGNGYYVRCVKD